MKKHQLPVEKSFLFSSSTDFKVNAFSWCIIFYGMYIIIVTNEVAEHKVVTGNMFGLFMLLSLLVPFLMSLAARVKTYLQGYTRPETDKVLYAEFNSWRKDNQFGKIVPLEKESDLPPWTAIFHPYIATSEGFIFGLAFPLILIAVSGTIGVLAIKIDSLFAFIAIFVIMIAIPFSVLYGCMVRVKNIEKLTMRDKIEGKL